MSVRSWTAKLAKSLGVDEAIAFTLLGRVWSAVAGPFTVLFISRCLSLEEQGFYYTFGSILALQVFFELGLAYVIFQFASHEKAKLHWAANGTLQGDASTKSRLASLLRQATAWYGVVAILAVVVLLPVGLWFFRRSQPPQSGIVWEMPWVWVVLVSVSGLLTAPIFALLEGCGLVAQLARLRTLQAVGGSVTLWLGLLLRGSLFAGPLSSTFGLIVALGWLAHSKRNFLRDILSGESGNPSAELDWAREIWPFQWRIALSVISSYFIYALFNPILFSFHGAAEAGRMGMSLSLIGAIAAIASVWITTKAAPFGTLIAQRDYDQLDRLFFPALWRSFGVIVVGGVTFWVGVWYLRSVHHPFSQRLLEPLPLGLLILTSLLNHIVGAEAIYLRAHKQEPFLVISIVIAVLVGMSTYFLGRPFGAMGMMAGYFAVNLLFGLGAGTWIFMHKRRLWRREAAALVEQEQLAPAIP